MAISVRKRIVPTVNLTGQPVNGSTGIIASSVEVFTFDASRNDVTMNLAQNIVTKRDPLVFYNEVKIDVTPPYSTYSYNDSADEGLVGSAIVETGWGVPIVGAHCEVYGTFNGKDPSRTKKHLWQGRSRYLRYNKSGSDNVILKVRTFYRGELSDVLTVCFRVIRPNSKIINNS